jgi:transposase-like protein
VPFLEYDARDPPGDLSPARGRYPHTNAIESSGARYRRAVRARGHFPHEAAAIKCLYLVTRSLDPTGGGRARRAIRWKPALNAHPITFAGRFERTTH